MQLCKSLLFVTAYMFCLPAMSAQWVANQDSGKLTFTWYEASSNFEGQFTVFNSEMSFDENDLNSFSLHTRVETGSARTGEKESESMLPEKDLFFSKMFPDSNFVAKQIVATGSGEYTLQGELTLRDITMGLDIPVKIKTQGDKLSMSGGTTIIRIDFGVGEGMFADEAYVKFPVDVNFDLTYTKQ